MIVEDFLQPLTVRELRIGRILLVPSLLVNDLSALYCFKVALQNDLSALFHSLLVNHISIVTKQATLVPLN